MPPTKPSQKSNLGSLENFFVDGDLSDDPFASPQKDKAASKKRKSDGLGLDEEVAVTKKPREPRVKLDQERLLSQKGVPALRKKAGKLKLKGKGHEWSDAHRLLSFYQEWLDDLFPKAKFIDALAMVEKAGHNKTLRNLRVDWINEGRPKATVVEDGGDAEPDTEQQDAPKQAERVVPTFEASGRPRTPELDDLFGGDNIYNATPQAETRKSDGGEPDEDELDALMAMEDAGDAPAKTSSGGYQSIFGDGKPKAPEPPPADDDDDDLDALMAEAEAEKTSDQKVVPAAPKTRADDEDDLDALMAEEEAHTAAEERTIPVGSKAASKEKMPDFDDEEEAMAEMDELW